MRWDRIKATLEVVSVAVLIVFSIFPEGLKENSWIILITAFLLIGVVIALDYVMEKFDQIKDHEKRIKEVENKLNIKDMMNELRERIAWLEGKKPKRKGQIDPRIILWIIIIFLIYMFLKSQGIIG